MSEFVSAATRISMQLKFGALASGDKLEHVLISADSLLGTNAQPTPEIAGYLAPVSAMTGQCEQTSKLPSRSEATPAANAGMTNKLPRDVEEQIAAIEAYYSWLDAAGLSMFGGGQLTSRRVFLGLRRLTNDAKQLEYLELNAIVRAIVPPDSGWVNRFAGRGGRTIVAERFIAEGMPDSAPARLREAARVRRGALAGQVTADAVVAEARVWLLLADTASAIASLEEALTAARHAPPLLTNEFRYNAGRMGFLIQAYALHAQLMATRDRVKARQSARIAVAMWRNADREHQPTVERLREILRKSALPALF